MTNSRGHYLGDDRFGPLVAELDRRAAVVLLHPTSTEHHLSGAQNMAWSCDLRQCVAVGHDGRSCPCACST